MELKKIDKQKVIIEKEDNDFFGKWIIEEQKHHNTVDQIYQLRIIKPEELKFEENEEYFKILFENDMVVFIGIKNNKKEIYLYRLFISEQHRNKGIAQNKDMSLNVI